MGGKMDLDYNALFVSMLISGFLLIIGAFIGLSFCGGNM